LTIILLDIGAQWYDCNDPGSAVFSIEDRTLFLFPSMVDDSLLLRLILAVEFRHDLLMWRLPRTSLPRLYLAFGLVFESRLGRVTSLERLVHSFCR